MAKSLSTILRTGSPSTPLQVANGGTGSTSTTYCSLTTNVTGTLPVANGGTGLTTITANSVLLGNGTSAPQLVAPGTSGNILTSNGTTWTSAAAPASGGITLISTISPTAGSVSYNITNIASYKSIKVLMFPHTQQYYGSYIGIQISVDNGVTWTYAGGNYPVSSTFHPMITFIDNANLNVKMAYGLGSNIGGRFNLTGSINAIQIYSPNSPGTFFGDEIIYIYGIN